MMSWLQSEQSLWQMVLNQTQIPDNSVNIQKHTEVSAFDTSHICITLHKSPKINERKVKVLHWNGFFSHMYSSCCCKTVCRTLRLTVSHVTHCNIRQPPLKPLRREVGWSAGELCRGYALTAPTAANAAAALDISVVWVSDIVEPLLSFQERVEEINIMVISVFSTEQESGPG